MSTKELKLGRQTFLSIENTRIRLWQPNGKSIELSNIQTKMLLDGMDIIDNGADVAWEHLDAEAKHEYQYHLGFRVNLTLSLYRGARFYDVRRWWMPANCTNPIATRTGITLNAEQAKVLREARSTIIQTIPALEEIGPCECWLEIGLFTRCQRCNPWDIFNQ
jgi:hypothetical protein